MYFGIDDVRGWHWALLLPGVWALATVAGLVWGHVVYQQDPQAGASLIVFAFLWCLPWTIALFYLAKMNTA